MSAYFFDSSALIKRYVNETGSVWVRSLMILNAGHTIFIAPIARTEAMSAFA